MKQKGLMTKNALTNRWTFRVLAIWVVLATLAVLAVRALLAA